MREQVIKQVLQERPYNPIIYRFNAFWLITCSPRSIVTIKVFFDECVIHLHGIVDEKGHTFHLNQLVQKDCRIATEITYEGLRVKRRKRNAKLVVKDSNHYVYCL